MNPSKPIQAVARWTKGLSKTAPALPILERKEVNVKRKKKMRVKAMETAINAGVVAVGADKRSGAPLGRTSRSRKNSEF